MVRILIRQVNEYTVLRLEFDGVATGYITLADTPAVPLYLHPSVRTVGNSVVVYAVDQNNFWFESL